MVASAWGYFMRNCRLFVAKFWHFGAISLLITALSSGCSSAKTDDQPGTQPLTKAHVLGVVFDESGAAISGVSVTGPGVTVTTQTDGRFDIAVARSGVAVLSFTKNGFTPAYRPVDPQGGGLVTTSAVLTKPTQTSEVDLSAGPQTVTVAAGVTLEFPQEGVVLANGQKPTGKVQVVSTWLPPATAFNKSPFPMQASDGVETWPLETFGMIDVQLTVGGLQAKLAAGKIVKLRLPAAASDPDSTGLFYGDPSTGTWKLEGAASKINGQWVADLPHLSWWNLDGFYKVPIDQRACVTFVAKTADGKPLPGVQIRSKWGPNGKYTIAGATDTKGQLCEYRFPGGESLEITWKAFISAGSSVWVTNMFGLTPSAYGAKCNTAACQVVNIPINCTHSTHCDGGGLCESGICLLASGVDAGSTDAGGVDTSPGPVCTPKCVSNQCSDNGCGTPCSECPSGKVCNPDTEKCEACTPDCSGQVCGSDGCQGDCGVCAAGTSCDGSKCVGACTFCPSGNCTTFGLDDNLDGWDATGDVVLIDKLGATGAPQGAKMLRLSTGLAYAKASYAQKALCIKDDVKTLTLRWRLYSEEFMDYCGSKYQDYFSVRINVGGTEKELLKRTIDSLCPVGAKNCTTCGTSAVGLTKSDIHFDKGDAYMTPWQTAVLALPAGAKAGTVILEVADVGDSAYDTVVLIDDLRLTE